MDSDEEILEMSLLQAPNSDDYALLLDLLKNAELDKFKKLARHILSTEPRRVDVNHLMPHPVNMTLLDCAVSANLPDFVEFLLDIGADPNLINSEHKRAPIHFATVDGNAEALSVLLRDENIQPNLQVEGYTALHYAVKANSLDCVRLLLEAGASPNLPNNRGVTALHLAAIDNNRNIVQLIVLNSCILDLDTYKDRRQDTARQIIERKFPDIALPPVSNVKDYPALLMYYLTSKDEANFLKILSEADDKILYNKAELAKLAIERNLIDALKELDKRGAFDEANLYEFGKIAVEQSHCDILAMLLKKNPNLANRLLLPASQELGIYRKSSSKNRNNRFECLKIILSQRDVDLRQEDEKGNSPLHYAARAECREAVELLLKKGCYIGHTNKFGASALAYIAPDTLSDHFDRCIKSENEHTEEYEIIMNYRNLVPHDARHNGNVKDEDLLYRNETEALVYIANNKNLRHLLVHPLLASFLYLKYLRIRHILYINFFLYLVYFATLIGYIWVIAKDEDTNEESTNNITSTLLNKQNDEKIENDIFENWRKHYIMSILLTVSMIYLIIRELLQSLASPLNYIINPENWLEITLIGISIWLLLGANRAVSAVAILLSTWEFVILMSKHPRMSTDMEMLKTVTTNFFKSLLLYIFIILAFALSFYVLFKGNDNFLHPQGSLFKTLIMLTGEFDSGDLPFSGFPVLSRLVFVCFILLIVIILLNLLNGLAVNDTAVILSEAELVGLISRVRLIAYAERIAVGSKLVSKKPFYCLKYLTKLMKRRILLFPRYLPEARLSVKPLKNYAITLHGKLSSTGRSKCSTLKMDPVVARRAKSILMNRDRESNERAIVAQWNALMKKLNSIETIVRGNATILKYKNENTIENIE